MKTRLVKTYPLLRIANGFLPLKVLLLIEELGRILLYALDVILSCKLKFPCSNNDVEYEALIIGLTFALQMGTR